MAFNKEMDARIRKESVLCRKIVNLQTGEQFLNNTKPSDWVVGANGLIARVAREWRTLYEHAIKNPEQLERIFGSNKDAVDPDAPPPTLSEAELKEMSYKDLCELARTHGVKYTGVGKPKLVTDIFSAITEKQLQEFENAGT